MRSSRSLFITFVTVLYIMLLKDIDYARRVLLSFCAGSPPRTLAGLRWHTTKR